MRNYQPLDTFRLEGKTLYLIKTDPDPGNAMVVMLREGQRIVISISIGSLELALRLRYDDFQRQVRGLKPISGLATTRQVGSGQAYIGLGLTENSDLILRPTLVSDATGHLTINLLASKDVFEQLSAWLQADA